MMQNEKLLDLEGGKVLYDDLRDRIENKESEIIISGTEPTEENNKLWIDYNETEEYSVPTYAEYLALSNKVDAAPTDIQINGTSIVDDGVANIPVASSDDYGAVKVNPGFGIYVYEGSLRTALPSNAQIQAGNNGTLPLTPSSQHVSTFYGLAKAAGDTTQAASSNAVGTYTADAKAAIKEMLGVGDSDISDVQVNGTSVVSNGVANVPVTDTSGTVGVVYTNTDYGIGANDSGRLFVANATSAQVKAGTHQRRPVVPLTQHESAFYGLAKAAGDSTQESSSNAVGTYTDAAKTAIRGMLNSASSDIVKVSDTQPTATDNKLWITDTPPASVQVPTVAEMNAAIGSAVTVEDVQVNGTSVVTNGVANVPLMSSSSFGVAKTGGGLTMVDGTTLSVSPASSNDIKGGTVQRTPVTPVRQHESVFYGLAKAAGDSTQSASSNAVGTYTADAKAAIKTMLGVTDPAVSDVQVNGTSVANNGVANIPLASIDTFGVVKTQTNRGLTMSSDSGVIMINSANTAAIKAAVSGYLPIVPYTQHESVFYGLAKAAGTDLANETVTVGTYPASTQTAIKSMLGVIDIPAVTSSDNGKVLRVVNGVWTAAQLPSASGVSF